MVSTLKTEIKTDDYVSTLIISEADRYDTADNEVKANSTNGTPSQFVNIQIKYSPGAVEGSIMICSVTSNKFLLSYTLLKNTGGSKITGFRIEKRETSRLSWLVVHHCAPETACAKTQTTQNHILINREMEKHG